MDDLIVKENPNYKSSLSKKISSSIIKEDQIKIKINNDLKETIPISEESNSDKQKNDKENKKINKKENKLELGESYQPSKEKIEKSIINSSIKQNDNIQIDPILNKEFYDEKVEKFYHSAEKMQSIGVMTKEIELMDYIIDFCNKNSLEFLNFDSKKFFLKNNLDVLLFLFLANHKKN